MVSLPKQASRPLFLNTGCAARVFGLVAPRSLKIVYIAWMSLAFTMGLLASAVVLTIFYFPVITLLECRAIIWQGLPFRKTRSQREELLAGARSFENPKACGLRATILMSSKTASPDLPVHPPSRLKTLGLIENMLQQHVPIVFFCFC
jgi:Saxitoxin biosynthesis operon protein SxtJ